jgi:hypothetical protein
MAFTAKKQSYDSSISATQSDGHLVLSFPDAVEPVIWRRSLEEISSATFEVKQVAKKDHYNLVLKKAKSPAETIATFESREEAVDALKAASNALHGGGETRRSFALGRAPKEDHSAGVTSPARATAGPSDWQKWVIAILGVIVVLGLYFFMNTLLPERTTDFGTGATSASSTAPVTSPQDSTGVPVSADDFLSGS